MIDPSRAWIDESGSDRTLDPQTYILAAAITRTSIEDDLRGRMAALRLRGQLKVHWRDEASWRQTTLCKEVAALDLESIVVVRPGRTNRQAKPERQRRETLDRLLWELESLGVSDVVLESRGRADDQRDVELANALRGQRRLSTNMRLTHRLGRNEPLLWIPDVICGAVSHSRTGAGQYLDLLDPKVRLIEI